MARALCAIFQELALAARIDRLHGSRAAACWPADGRTPDTKRVGRADEDRVARAGGRRRRDLWDHSRCGGGEVTNPGDVHDRCRQGRLYAGAPPRAPEKKRPRRMARLKCDKGRDMPLVRTCVSATNR